MTEPLRRHGTSSYEASSSAANERLLTDPKSKDVRAMLKKARSLLLALDQRAQLEPESRRWLESIEESFPTWISKIL